MKSLSAFLCGWLFSLGLGLAGMAQPSRIIGFLDVTGAWDPTLMFVMAGAVGMGLITFPLVLKRTRPVLESEFLISDKTRVDSRLIIGAALFGAGWGVSGYCPGPALLSLVTLQPGVWVFVASMFAGLALGGSRKS